MTKDLICVALIWVIAIFIINILTIGRQSEELTVVKYDCRLAEISPDYPQDVKNKCRKIMQNN